MNQDQETKYAIACLFTLAVHSCQVDNGIAADGSILAQNPNAWGIEDEDHFERIVDGQARLNDDLIQEYWGIDTIGKYGICQKVFSYLDIPHQRWKSILKLPFVVCDQTCAEYKPTLTQIVNGFLCIIDPSLTIDNEDAVSQQFPQVIQLIEDQDQLKGDVIEFEKNVACLDEKLGQTNNRLDSQLQQQQKSSQQQNLQQEEQQCQQKELNLQTDNQDSFYDNLEFSDFVQAPSIVSDCSVVENTDILDTGNIPSGTNEEQQIGHPIEQPMAHKTKINNACNGQGAQEMVRAHEQPANEQVQTNNTQWNEDDLCSSTLNAEQLNTIMRQRSKFTVLGEEQETKRSPGLSPFTPIDGVDVSEIGQLKPAAALALHSLVQAVLSMHILEHEEDVTQQSNLIPQSKKPRQPIRRRQQSRFKRQGSRVSGFAAERDRALQIESDNEEEENLLLEQNTQQSKWTMPFMKNVAQQYKRQPLLGERDLEGSAVSLEALSEPPAECDGHRLQGQNGATSGTEDESGRQRRLTSLLHRSNSFQVELVKVRVRWYDARARCALKRLSTWFHVPRDTLLAFERATVNGEVEKLLTGLQVTVEDDQNAAVNKFKGRLQAYKWAAVGGAAAVGGTVLALTGGLLAAPALAGFVVPALTSMGIGGTVTTTLGAFAGSTAGIATITSTMGAIGAANTGLKMAYRMEGIQEFSFIDLEVVDWVALNLNQSENEEQQLANGVEEINEGESEGSELAGTAKTLQSSDGNTATGQEQQHGIEQHQEQLQEEQSEPPIDSQSVHEGTEQTQQCQDHDRQACVKAQATSVQNEETEVGREQEYAYTKDNDQDVKACIQGATFQKGETSQGGLDRCTEAVRAEQGCADTEICTKGEQRCMDQRDQQEGGTPCPTQKFDDYQEAETGSVDASRQGNQAAHNIDSTDGIAGSDKQQIPWVEKAKQMQLKFHQRLSAKSKAQPINPNPPSVKDGKQTNTSASVEPEKGSPVQDVASSSNQADNDVVTAAKDSQSMNNQTSVKQRINPIGALQNVFSDGGKSVLTPHLEQVPFSSSKGFDNLGILVCISGWVDSYRHFVSPWKNVHLAGCDMFALVWEHQELKAVGEALLQFVSKQLSQEVVKWVLNSWMAGLATALAVPMALTTISSVIDNAWDVAMARAVGAGQQLAHQLMAGAHGDRPVTLLGFSQGARLIFHCLLELHRIGARGIVEHAILLGGPIKTQEQAWKQVRSCVYGRLVNGYCTSDWVLGIIYRGRQGFLQECAGYQPVMVPGVENVNLSGVVQTHTDYLHKMDDILEVLHLRKGRTQQAV